MKRITLTLVVLAISITSTFAQIRSFDLKKGDVYQVSSVANLVVSQEVMGQKMDIIQNISTVESLEVLEVNNGIYKMKGTTEKMKIEVDAGMGGKQVMDSDGSDQMAEVSKAMVGKSYFFYMDQFGQLQSFEGLDEMSAAIKTDLDKTIIGQAGQSEQVMTMMNEETIRTTLGNLLTIYSPEGRDNWEHTSSVSLNNLPTSIMSKRYYDGTSTIMSAGELTVSGTTENMGMSIQADLAGSVNMIYDLMDNGMPSKVQVQQDAEGKASTQGIDIPMTIETKSTITVTRR
jgi:hypothetical protein